MSSSSTTSQTANPESQMPYAVGAMVGQVLPNAKWIRGMVGDATVVNTRNALFVWEFSYYAQWYFPLTDIGAELQPTGETTESDVLGTATVYDMIVDDPSDGPTVLHAAAWRYPDSPIEAIRDRVRVSWEAMDTWMEEEVEVFVHPRSPFTRVDILPSTRHVIISVDDTVVADSKRASILYETGLPARYYLPMEDVDAEFLTPTETSSACPYKGVAHYWDVTVGDSVHRDLVWGYRDPLPESVAVKGLACFYNEKVDIQIDGVPVDRPKTKFS